MLDVTGNGKLEFICAKEGTFPVRLIDSSQRPFVNVTSSVPAATQVNDSIVADFNRDLRNDIVMTRGSSAPERCNAGSRARHIEGWVRKNAGSLHPRDSRFPHPDRSRSRSITRGMGQTEPSKVFVLNKSGAELDESRASASEL